MPKKIPQASSPTVLALIREAKRQATSGYALTKATGLGLYTIQRLLAGEGSPTIDTVERVAKALGMTIKVEKGT